MSTGLSYISYSDHSGAEYTETCTSPIAQILREEELTKYGYIVHPG